MKKYFKGQKMVVINDCDAIVKNGTIVTISQSVDDTDDLVEVLLPLPRSFYGLGDDEDGREYCFFVGEIEEYTEISFLDNFLLE